MHILSFASCAVRLLLPLEVYGTVLFCPRVRVLIRTVLPFGPRHVILVLVSVHISMSIYVRAFGACFYTYFYICLSMCARLCAYVYGNVYNGGCNLVQNGNAYIGVCF